MPGGAVGASHDAAGLQSPAARPNFRPVNLDALVSKVQGYLPGAPIDVIRQAYEFSAEKHRNQLRLT